jgi:hypothetical protein
MQLQWEWAKKTEAIEEYERSTSPSPPPLSLLEKATERKGPFFPSPPSKYYCTFFTSEKFMQNNTFLSAYL